MGRKESNQTKLYGSKTNVMHMANTIIKRIYLIYEEIIVFDKYGHTHSSTSILRISMRHQLKFTQRHGSSTFIKGRVIY